MTALIVTGCVLLFFWLVGMLGFNVILTYDGQLAVKIRVLFITVHVIPKKRGKPPDPDRYSPEKYRKMLEKAAEKEAKKQQKKNLKAERENAKPDGSGRTPSKAGAEKKVKRSVSDILELVRQILAAVKGLLRSFGAHLQIEAVRLRITVASGDAAKTALLYGAVCQSVACILEILSNVTNFKAKDREQITVDADFLGEKSAADLYLIFRLRVWHVFAMLFSALGGFIREKISGKT